MARRLLRRYVASFEGLPREVWLLAAVLLVNRCGTMVFPFMTIYLIRERGYDPSTVGWLMSAVGLGGVGGSYLGGRLTHWCGPMPVIAAALASAAPLYAVIPWCPGLITLACALFVRQLVAETMRPACITATTLFSAPEQHPRALALNRLASNLGCSIGPVIGGALAMIDFRLIFPTNGAFCFLAACATVAFFGRACYTRTPPPADDGEETTQAVSPWRDGLFVAFLVAFAAIAVVFFQVINALPLYWREQCGFNELTIGTLFAVNTVLIVLFEMPLTSALRAVRPLVLVALGALLYGIGFGLTPLGSAVPVAMALVAVWTFGEMISAPFSATFVASRSGASQRGLYMGAYAMALTAANVLAPTVGLTLYAWDPAAPWWVGAVVAVASGGALLLIDRRIRAAGKPRVAVGVGGADSPPAAVGL